MPNLYARATALPNVVGRVDYISNPDRQERLLAAYDGAAELLEGQFWRLLAKESRAAFEKFGYEHRAGHEKKLKCCEGREIVMQLSNALLRRMTPEEIAKIIADEFREKEGLIVAVGIHLKHKGDGPDNLHAHVVFPERQLLQDPVVKTAERNLFFDANGRRVYKKAEILDENKQLLPGCRIVKKGEIYEQHYFGSVDPMYSYKSWLESVKTNLILELRNGKLKGDVEITEYDPRTGKLPLQHIGRGVSAEKAKRILQTNDMVREFNRLVEYEMISKTKAREYQAMVLEAADRRAALKKALWELVEQKFKLNQEPPEEADEVCLSQEIKAHRNWQIQRKLDTIRVARETGARTASDLEDKLQQYGRELGQAKKAYDLAQKNGSLDDVMKTAEAYRAASEKYAEVSKAVDTLQKERYRRESELDDR